MTGWRSITQVALSALLTAVCLLAPATAHAQYDPNDPRFGVVDNYYGQIQFLYQDAFLDEGSFADSWEYVGSVPSTSLDGTVWGGFVGAAAPVSDQKGRIWLAARTDAGYLDYNVYSVGGDSWRGWARVPGTAAGGVCISGRCYDWSSHPALSSWGAGRLELFIIGIRRDDGAISLLHTWGDNATWSGRWEFLGSGWLQGSPTAVSWGPGRTDVFVVGGANDLVHKWFANGSWSRGWESLGGYITSSPAVASMQFGHLDISVRGGDGALYHKWFINNNWSDWEWLGGNLVVGPDPTSMSAGPGFLKIYVYNYDQWSGPYSTWSRRELFDDWWYDFTPKGQPVADFYQRVFSFRK